jgi:hypothetical protein
MAFTPVRRGSGGNCVGGDGPVLDARYTLKQPLQTERFRDAIAAVACRRR